MSSGTGGNAPQSGGNALGGAVQSALGGAIAAAGGAANADEAYKAFMAKLGEGITQAIGDAVGAAVGELRAQGGAAGGSASLQIIADTLSQGASVQLSFPTPGLLIPMTQKVTTKFAAPGAAGGGGALGGGGSVGVTGSYSF